MTAFKKVHGDRATRQTGKSHPSTEVSGTANILLRDTFGI